MDINTGFRVAPYKRASFNIHLLGWVKARLRDIVIAAEVLHDVQFAAPWLDHESPHPPSRQCIRQTCF
jgi:hypothetical protein